MPLSGKRGRSESSKTHLWMIQVEASTWSSPRPGTYSFAWIMIHVWMNLKALDLDHALAGTGLDLEVSRAQAFLMIWRVPDKLGP